MTHLEVAMSWGELLRTKCDLAEAAEEKETERSAIDTIAATTVLILVTSTLQWKRKVFENMCQLYDASLYLVFRGTRNQVM
jgi:hypothetical protein